jgi:hypothetical protein
MVEAENIVLNTKSFAEFLKWFRSEAARESYTKKLRHFLVWAGIDLDEFRSAQSKLPMTGR